MCNVTTQYDINFGEVYIIGLTFKVRGGIKQVYCMPFLPLPDFVHGEL